MNKRSLLYAFLLSLAIAAVYMAVLALAARVSTPMPYFASDLASANDPLGKSVRYFMNNIKVLGCFAILMGLIVMARNRSERNQWHTLCLVLGASVVALLIFGQRMLPGLAALAGQMNLDPVQLLALMPHGLLEFGAMVFPSLFALVCLARNSVLPGAMASIFCLIGAVIMLTLAAGMEGFVTPQLLLPHVPL
jgi:uncharacterized membrane protein SpoIIM required for sporulation